MIFVKELERLLDNLTVIGDPCVVALCECNDRGGDWANEVSLYPEGS